MGSHKKLLCDNYMMFMNMLLLVWLCPLVHMFPSAPSNPNYDIDTNLDFNFYDTSCPNLLPIVRYGVWSAIRNDTRMAASLLRLHFHDCIVDGCDGSVLLDDTEDMKGEKNAFPNRKSLRGYEVIDSIKAELESYCPSTVSCADILALAAREAVLLAGGPFWAVGLGRRDSLTASEDAANQQIPSPLEPLQNITAKFASRGLDLKDVVVLSGGHTIGFAQCSTFKGRLFNFQGTGKPDPVLSWNWKLLSNLRSMCPNRDSSSDAKLAPLDASTSFKFDNAYYANLLTNSGLLQSDHALVAHSATLPLVKFYSDNPFAFSRDFSASMLKLSSLAPLTGYNHGQIRLKCSSLN